MTGDAEIDLFGAGDPEDDSGFGGTFGLYNWRDDFGLGIEAGILQSEVRPGRERLLETDEVTATRYLVGLRFADRMGTESFMAYLRGGFMWRDDDGDLIGADGSGFYAGLGLDVRIAGPVWITPEVLYTDSESLGGHGVARRPQPDLHVLNGHP